MTRSEAALLAVAALFALAAVLVVTAVLVTASPHSTPKVEVVTLSNGRQVTCVVDHGIACDFLGWTSR